MRSDTVIQQFRERFAEICALPTADGPQRIDFLRRYLATLNEFLYERRREGLVDELNAPDGKHPEWRRITPFLAIWDDYAESVLGFSFDDRQVRMVAELCVAVFRNCPWAREAPAMLPPDEPADSLAGLTPREFALMRLMHALQDFSQRLPPINAALVTRIREQNFGIVPDEEALSNEDVAAHLLAGFGGADRNVDERIRYVFSSARILRGLAPGGAYKLAAQCGHDAQEIFRSLNKLPGLKRKKAHMIMRDFYELGIWTYGEHLQDINIIADQRVTRVALRSGIMRPALGKLLNSLLDQFDFQYVLTVAATEEAFRRVWDATPQFNEGRHAVSYPARLDELIFKLADGRRGCCKPRAMACRTGRRPTSFHAWLSERYAYETPSVCPFDSICPDDCRDMLQPFAIQNNTWMKIFTGSGGGGGLDGV